MAKDLFKQELKIGDYIIFPQIEGRESEYSGVYYSDFMDGYITKIIESPSGNAIIEVKAFIYPLIERLNKPTKKDINSVFKCQVLNSGCINANEKRNLIPAMFI